MSYVASRDLRNHTAAVLQRAANGERVTVTVNGQPIAEIGPAAQTRPAAFSRASLLKVLAHRQSDSGLARDLETLAGATTDDLDL